ncbi:DNA-binding response regulator [Paenibacillus sp. NPDC058071]|uniref:DNA-binding response regulator n=1 Tax=Paenibacillus sp. NPDC058071 TaxID=3346326 RepID=UPI0036D97A42
MFELHFKEWMILQLSASSGERKRRLMENRHAENQFLKDVWWPVAGQFDYLSAEYEIHDFKDGKRFLDYAYIRPPYRVCFEIDGYGPHSRDISRDQFADQLMRQNYLVLDNWIVLRFSYDDIVRKPRQCQQIIYQMFGKLYHINNVSQLSLHQKEILRYMTLIQRPVTSNEISCHLNVGIKRSRKWLRLLLESQHIQSVTSESLRIHKYKLKEH